MVSKSTINTMLIVLTISLIGFAFKTDDDLQSLIFVILAIFLIILIIYLFKKSVNEGVSNMLDERLKNLERINKKDKPDKENNFGEKQT